MRRANGMGTIYKLKGRRRKPYVASITLGWDDEHNKRLRKSCAFASQPDAQAWLDKYTNNHDLFDTEKITLGELIDAFIASKKKEIQDSSMSIYLGVIDNYLKPHRNKLVATIKTMHLQAIIDDIDAASSKENTKSVLSQAYELAMASDIVQKNYAKYIKLPAREKSEKHIPFALDEIRRLWELSPSDPDARLLLTYIYTGCRPVELVTISLVNVHDDYMIGGVKTDAGKMRIIPIADCIKPFVLEYMRKAMAIGIKTLIPAARGNIAMTRDAYRVRMPTITKRLGLSHHTPHDTRHTFVTMADNIGMNKKIKKMIVGHETGDITTDVYTHKTRQQLIDAVNKLPHGVDMDFTDDKEKCKPRVSHGRKIS